MLEKLGLVYIDAIVWKKQGVTGIRLSHQKTHRKYYPGFSFELCLVFQKDNTSFPTFDEEYKDDLQLTNVWEIATENSGIHSAPYPVRLPETAIKSYTNSKLNKVYEPFCGSGTTLIACEKTGRTCYGIELSPAYCDVIIKRWQEFTGKEALNATTGHTFNTLPIIEEIANARTA
jgi:DNA modification methylase